MTRFALWLPMLAAALAMAPNALADNTFFLGDGTLSTTPPEGGLKTLPLATRPLVGGLEPVLSWSYTLERPALLAPSATHFVLNVTEATPVPPSVQVDALGVVRVNACAFHLYVGTDEQGYVYCGGQYQGTVLQPGRYALDFDWRGDLEPLSVAAGTQVWVEVSTGAVSPSGRPTMAIDVMDPADPSRLVLRGTSEPAPPPPAPVADPAPGTATSAASTSRPSSSTSPPSSTTSEPGPSSGPAPAPSQPPERGRTTAAGSEATAGPVEEHATKATPLPVSWPLWALVTAALLATCLHRVRRHLD